VAQVAAVLDDRASAQWSFRGALRRNRIPQNSTETAVSATWISGTLTLAMIAHNPKRMRQSTPTLIPNEGSWLSCLAERRCSDTARLLVIEDLLGA
jgi:hypothetical protein